MKKTGLLTLLMVLVATSAINCQAPGDTSNAGRPPMAEFSKFSADTLYSGFKNPWGLTFLSDGRMLVTERAGEILVFQNDQFSGIRLKGVPKVFNEGQGGLLDITAHPDYAKNGWIYISYSKPVEGGATTAVMRFKLNGNEMVSQEEIFTAKPYIKANFHFGSRIIFDKNNMLFVSVGERGTQPKVQQLDNDHGKIHRLYDDGRIPKDNPFAGQKYANKSIYTYGHRNPQGMVYDAANDRIWAVEHGPKGGDELNLIKAGKNYGWPIASYGINYNGTILTPNKQLPGITDPVRYWVPSMAPCGMTLVTSDRYPSWKGDLLVGALSFTYIARVQLNGTTFKNEEKLLEKVGRVRDVEQSPDGYIYAITEGPGRLLKILP